MRIVSALIFAAVTGVAHAAPAPITGPGPNACNGYGCLPPSQRPDYVWAPGPNACNGSGCLPPSQRADYVWEPGPNRVGIP